MHPNLLPTRMRAVFRLPTCVLGLQADAAGSALREIRFLAPDTLLEQAGDLLTQRFLDEIEHYLADPAHIFDLPLERRGTPFQQRVWQAIRDVPTGQTRQYGELACILGSVPRAVGQACGANPFPLATPCHRVLAKLGPGGFAHARGGWLLETKLWLLQHEQAI